MKTLLYLVFKIISKQKKQSIIILLLKKLKIGVLHIFKYWKYLKMKIQIHVFEWLISDETIWWMIMTTSLNDYYVFLVKYLFLLNFWKE